MGVTVYLLTFIPVLGSCIACVVYIGAGMLAVWHYTTTYQVTIPGGQGAGVGALAGVLAAVVAQLLSYLSSSLGFTPTMTEAMRNAIEQQNLDPDQAEEIINMFSSPGFLIGAILVSLIVAALLGIVGGIIGASAFKKGGTTEEDRVDVI